MYTKPIEHGHALYDPSKPITPIYLEDDIAKLGALTQEREKHGRLLGLLYRQIKGKRPRTGKKDKGDDRVQ